MPVIFILLSLPSLKSICSYSQYADLNNVALKLEPDRGLMNELLSLCNVRYCRRAKAVFKELNKVPHVVELDQRGTCLISSFFFLFLVLFVVNSNNSTGYCLKLSVLVSCLWDPLFISWWSVNFIRKSCSGLFSPYYVLLNCYGVVRESVLSFVAASVLKWWLLNWSTYVLGIVTWWSVKCFPNWKLTCLFGIIHSFKYFQSIWIQLEVYHSPKFESTHLAHVNVLKMKKDTN